MEEQILRFYLKVFSFLSIFVIYFFYLFVVREINLKKDYFFIKKNENYINIINNNIIDNNINLFFYKLTLRTLLLVNKEIHFGKFKLNVNPTYYQILKTIVLPSNSYNKITAKGTIRLATCLWLAVNYESRHLILGGGFFMAL